MAHIATDYRGVAGAGSSVGGPADLEEYTRWQWMTIRDVPPQYPF